MKSLKCRPGRFDFFECLTQSRSIHEIAPMNSTKKQTKPLYSQFDRTSAWDGPRTRCAGRKTTWCSRRCAVLGPRPRRLRRAGGGLLASRPPPKKNPTRRGAGGSSTASARHTDARGSGVAGDGVRVGKGCATKAAEPVGEPSHLEAGDAAGDDSGSKAGGRGELASSAGGASL